MSEERKPPLFSRVRCRAYLKAAKDGIRMEMYDQHGNPTERLPNAKRIVALRWDASKSEKVELMDLSECDGTGVKKVYRKRVEAEFMGVVAGYKHIDVAGTIGTDWQDTPYSDGYAYFFKNITERPKVGVVYFKNNCKRYVLPEDMEVEE